MNATTLLPNIERTAAILGQVADLWIDPNSAWRTRAVDALQVSTGFSRSRVERAITAAFEELTEAKILEYCTSEPAFHLEFRAAERVLHVLAGNVFTSWLPGAVVTLLLGARCDLKPSSREPLFASLWKKSLEQAAPRFAARVQLVPWREDLLQDYSTVVAYGSDETLKLLRAKALPEARFVSYGHKLSVAVIWEDVFSEMSHGELRARLEKDSDAFELEGCLSPRVIYLEKADPELLMPLLGGVPVMPHLKRFDSWDELRSELHTFLPHLSTFGYAGPAERTEEVRIDIDALGFSRVCELGEMQQPPLTWRNGGISLAEVLTRS